MDKRKIGVLLTVSLLAVSLPPVNTGYAAERDDIISETLETVPDAGYELGDSTERPDGIVQRTVKTTAVDEDGGTSTEVVEVTGHSSMPDSAEIGLYPEDVVNMVMPVIPEDTYDFVMDSQDLLSQYSIFRDTYEPASLYFTNSYGEKTHTCISDIALAKNKSSVPVVLRVTLQIENENDWPVNYTDMDSVEADDEKNVSFALIPVSVNEIDPDDASDEGNAAADEVDDTEDIAEEDMIDEEPANGISVTNHITDADSEADKTETGPDSEGNRDRAEETPDYELYEDKMICVDEEGKAEMVLLLPGTPDNFDIIDGRYMAKDDAAWSTLGFAVKGACNRQADWKEIDERAANGEGLNIRISYRMDTLTEEETELLKAGESIFTMFNRE